MSQLSGHHAFVTGSTGGIGLEIAKALYAAGASVVLHGRRTDGQDLSEARAQNLLPAAVPVVLGDLTEPMPQGPLQVAEEALRLSPEIDLVVCNAGTFIDQPFLEMDFRTFDRTMKLNVYSQYVLIQYFARHWVKRGIRGRILLIGSINGRLAEPTHVAYDTSKGAIDAMTRSLCVARTTRHSSQRDGSGSGCDAAYGPGTPESACQKVDGTAYAKRSCPRCRRLPGCCCISVERRRRTHPWPDAAGGRRHERMATAGSAR
jgi:NADP-dependent 3-hydroxy acid dehydrogenase YdfG